MKWFRLYAEFSTDPKIQTMSETFQRRFIMFLCLKCAGELHKLSREELAFFLRITEDELEKTIEVFLKKNLITENLEITSWDKRQYVSDNSTDRVRKFRSKNNETKRNVSETFQKQDETVTVTPPDTDTDTEKEKNNKKENCFEQQVDELWNVWIPAKRTTKKQVRKALLTALKKSPFDEILSAAREYIASPMIQSRIKALGETSVKGLPVWLNAEGWTEDRSAWKVQYTRNGEAPAQPQNSIEDELEQYKRSKILEEFDKRIRDFPHAPDPKLYITNRENYRSIHNRESVQIIGKEQWQKYSNLLKSKGIDPSKPPRGQPIGKTA